VSSVQSVQAKSVFKKKKNAALDVLTAGVAAGTEDDT
jgi:hypothetical protein